MANVDLVWKITQATVCLLQLPAVERKCKLQLNRFKFVDSEDISGHIVPGDW